MNDAVLKLLAKHSAVVTDGHFVYKSKRHGSVYVNKDAVFPHTKATDMLCVSIAQKFYGSTVDVVIGPVTGGAIMAQLVAHELTKHNFREVLAVFADKDGEDFVIKRGYDKLVSGRRVLVVEDLLTTGGSVAKVVAVVRACGGEIVGVGALCNRGGVTAEALGSVPRLESLVDVELTSYDESECPLCASAVPINTNLGHGREYLARKADATV